MPSLLSLTYLGCCAADDPAYENTRALVLSAGNPYFHKGTAAEGLGGPHSGPGMIWPLGIITRALTSRDPHEVAQCLRTTPPGSRDPGSPGRTLYSVNWC